MYFFIFLAGIGLGYFGWRYVHQRRSLPVIPQQAFLLQAVQYLARGSVSDALGGLKNLYESAPNDVALGLALGTLFRRHGEILQAIRTHKHLLATPELDPTIRGFVLTELGADFLDSGLFERSEKSLDEAFNLLGPHPWYCDSALPLLIRMGKFEQACNLMNAQAQAYGLDVSHRLALLRQEEGLRAFAKGDFEQARACFQLALQHDPRCVSAMVHHCRSLRRLDLRSDGLNLLLRNRDWLLEQPWLFFEEWSKSVQSEQEIAAFEADLVAWCQKNREDWRSGLVLGRHFQKMGDVPHAFEQFMKGFSASPNQLLVHQAIWQFLLAQDRPIEFLRRYSSEVEREWIFLPPYECGECGYHTDQVFWYCPACHHFETCLERKI
ncbi:MAG: hypothetical protein H6510_04095 [Acidobacteria bacterium]|nr:hypothetical protein [Acidobacteriota bacterium]